MNVNRWGFSNIYNLYRSSIYQDLGENAVMGHKGHIWVIFIFVIIIGHIYIQNKFRLNKHDKLQNWLNKYFH